MEKKIIVLEIFISPESFHSDVFYDSLLELIKVKEMTCDHENGYIDQIYRIVDVKNPVLLDNGYCKLQVNVECNVFKPVIGKQIRVRVNAISPHGVFAELGKNRFLIPAEKINKNQMLSHGQDIDIVITNFRYDYKCFCCIGELIAQ